APSRSYGLLNTDAVLAGIFISTVAQRIGPLAQSFHAGWHDGFSLWIFGKIVWSAERANTIVPDYDELPRWTELFDPDGLLNSLRTCISGVMYGRVCPLNHWRPDARPPGQDTHSWCGQVAT